MHLILDGYDGNSEHLQDLEFIYGLLDNYPARIGMRKIMPPYVFRYADSRPGEWGISGFVLIAEGHISVHTFPDRGHINVDIFSATEFDAPSVVGDMKENFCLGKTRARLLENGLVYPIDLEGAVGIIQGRERE